MTHCHYEALLGLYGNAPCNVYHTKLCYESAYDVTPQPICAAELLWESVSGLAAILVGQLQRAVSVGSAASSNIAVVSTHRGIESSHTSRPAIIHPCLCPSVTRALATILFDPSWRTSFVAESHPGYNITVDNINVYIAEGPPAPHERTTSTTSSQ